MSTLLLSATPGDTVETVAENAEAGSGMQTSKIVELQINQSDSAVYDTGVSGNERQIYREEVLLILNLFEQVLIGYINWPYASS